MDKVDFFIIGAQKAGTTSLYRYLSEHPDIFMPEVKENHFFVEDRFYIKGEHFFHKYYDKYNDQEIKGGAYVHMLSSIVAPSRLADYNPRAKILIMLRNPMLRAYSAYHFALKNGWESPKNSFLDAFKLQDKRLNGSYTEMYDMSYFYVGLYYKHIMNWLEYFPKENFYIILDYEFKYDSQKVLHGLFTFLGVRCDVNINTGVIHNKAGSVKYENLNKIIKNKDSKLKQTVSTILPFQVRKGIRHLIKQFNEFNAVEKSYPPISIKDMEVIYPYFEDDIRHLSNILNRDLTIRWK